MPRHSAVASGCLSRAQVWEVDRLAIEGYGVPGVVLMENAGTGTARLLESLGIDGPMVIACGKGNNGGDGFVIARHLNPAGVTAFTGAVHVIGIGVPRAVLDRFSERVPAPGTSSRGRP